MQFESSFAGRGPEVAVFCFDARLHSGVVSLPVEAIVRLTEFIGHTNCVVVDFPDVRLVLNCEQGSRDGCGSQID